MYIVDLSDPSNPMQLPPWQFLGDGRPHGVWLNEGRDAVVRGASRPVRQRGQHCVRYRSKRAGDPGRQRLSVPSPQSAGPDYQQALLGGPGDGGGDVSPSASTGASTSSARTSPAAMEVLGVPRPHVPGGRPRMVIRRSSTSRDERNPKIIAELKLEVSDPANC